jgi:hypothetical protein
MPVDVFLVKEDSLPEEPSGIPLATLIDERLPTFGFGAVLEEPELAGHLRNALGLRWAGLFLVDSGGPHVFSLVNAREGDVCQELIVLDDQPILEHRGYLNARDTVDVQLELQPGLYEFAAWLACRRFDDETQFVLKMRGPHDRTIAPIPLGRFLYSP